MNDTNEPGATGPDSARVDQRDTTRKPRGRPFQKGNPGRRPGSRNKVPSDLKKAIAQDLPGIIAKLRERALAGNTPAAIALMRTILAPAKESTPPINFDLPEVSSPALAVEAMTAVVAGLASGALEPEQARALTAALDGLVKALETHDTAARLAALEARIQEKSR